MQARTTAFEGVYVLDLLGLSLRGGQQQKQPQLVQRCCEMPQAEAGDVHGEA